MGSADGARAFVHRPYTVDALARMLADAQAAGRRVTLVGGRHAFGDHFLPPADADAIDTTALGGALVSLEEEADGSRWVRVPGGFTFEELCRAVPGFLPRHPPTSDRITVAGALVACAHDSVGYFADHVRSFTLLTVDGRKRVCTASSPGLEGDLFRLVPGSFGALGVVLEVELRLRPAPPNRAFELTILERSTYADDRCLGRLEDLYRSGDYPVGRGFYVFGLRGATVLFGDREIPAEEAAALPTLFLTDDAMTKNIVLQALANRVPAAAHRLAPLVLRRGRRFRATPYGLTFFQRSYARAHAFLAAPATLPRLLRWAGVDPRLPVAHQTFCVRPSDMRPFLSLYFGVLDRYPDVVRRIEQQDAVRLPPCRWPLHAASGLPEGALLFSPSFSIRPGTPLADRAHAFLGEVAERAYQDLGIKTLLLKQAHVAPATLRAMHGDALARLERAKQAVDPHGVLTSRFLRRVLRETTAHVAHDAASA